MAHPQQPTQKLRDAWARVLEHSTAVDAASDSTVAGAIRLRMTTFEYLIRRCVLLAPPVAPSADEV